jgi:tRNA threonylcarbamoyl adenosine modification protein YeaZ
MKVLALDTTTRVGSVALVDDDRVVDERNGDNTRSHAERLPHELLAVATANGVALSTIDLFAVASGPGSFTGLRIGIATIQGLALVARRRVIGVPALDALAHVASLDLATGALVAAWMDAHRREVFAALYRVTAAPPFDPARLEELDPASAGDPGSVLTRWKKWAGTRAVRVRRRRRGSYAGQLRAAHPDAAVVSRGRSRVRSAGWRSATARNGAAIDPPRFVRSTSGVGRRSGERQAGDA